MLDGRNIGIGHRGLTKFAGTMNMPSPMNENAYRDHVASMNAAAEVVCKESMNKASEETKQFYEVEEDGNFHIGISADGTWRRRGFSSSYGVMAGISLVTGKILDVEVMSKETLKRRPTLKVCKSVCVIYMSSTYALKFLLPSHR